LATENKKIRREKSQAFYPGRKNARTNDFLRIQQRTAGGRCLLEKRSRIENFSRFRSWASAKAAITFAIPAINLRF
jgi:hypothetical protein